MAKAPTSLLRGPGGFLSLAANADTLTATGQMRREDDSLDKPC
jgi:hypothetical protein